MVARKLEAGRRPENTSNLEGSDCTRSIKSIQSMTSKLIEASLNAKYRLTTSKFLTTSRGLLCMTWSNLGRFSIVVATCGVKSLSSFQSTYFYRWVKSKEKGVEWMERNGKTS